MSEQNPPHQWQQWRQERATGLASEHGWLSVVGRDWLTDGADPRPISGFPGLWSADGKSVRARFAVDDQVSRDGEVIVGEVLIDLGDGDDSSLTCGTVRAEVLSRGDKVGVRYRDSAAPRRHGFDGVPCFDHDSAWRVPATFTARTPQQVELATVDPEVHEEAQVVGVVDFELGGEHYSLQVFGEPEKPFLNFFDQTNGEQTADWRFVMVDVAGGQIDFNYAMNFPFAFLPGGCTCPKPLSEARLKVAVTAGERRPSM